MIIVLCLSSYAVDCIQKLNTRQQSLTRGGGGAGQGNICSSTHSTRTPHSTQKGNKLKGSGKLLKWKLFNFLQLHNKAPRSHWSLQSSCSSAFCDTGDAELVTRSHVAWRLSCPRPSVSLAILASLPRSLLSLSPSDETLAVSVINSPPDINLFQ